MTARPMVADVRKIAVLRANGLGDFLFATPALRALARTFPDAEITYLGLPWILRFVTGRFSYIHHTLAVPEYPGIRAGPADGPAADEFFQSCRQERYDLAFQMHGGGRQSNPFVRNLGAALSVGLTSSDASALDVNVPYEFYQNEIMRYLELVAAVGVTPAGFEMDAPMLPSDELRLRSAWPALADGPFAVIHVGAGDVRRRWPIERFAAVATYLSRHRGLRVVATGSADDRALVDRLVALSTTPIVDLAGRIDLGSVVALLRRARLTVSNDTGISNLAIALDRPAVIIYWCGNLITAGPFRRANQRPVLSWTVHCPSCGLRRCRCQVTFVGDASLDEAIDQIDDLLDVPPKASGTPAT